MIKSQNEGQDYKVTKLQGLSDLMLSTKLACDLVSNIPADSELAVTSHVLEKVSSGEHFAHSMGQASQGVGGGQASPIQASPIQAGPDFKGRHTVVDKRHVGTMLSPSQLTDLLLSQPSQEYVDCYSKRGYYDQA